jgi:hypothetical protein
MKITVDLPDLQETVNEAVENALADKQTQLIDWKYFTLKETAELLQIKHSTLLDKRMPYLTELEYSRQGRIYWFTKKSVHEFIASRSIRKYKSPK